jgi:hypothetical protein
MFRQLHDQYKTDTLARGTLSVLAAAVIALGPATAARASDAACSPVMRWNQIALNATVLAGQGAVPQIRSLAIVHASMHDAVNAITGEYRTYIAATPAPAGASAEAAAIAAAHKSLTRLFGAQASTFETERVASLSACGLSQEDAGTAVGVAAADAILTLRSTDGAAQANFPYTAPGAGSPGVWVAEGPAPAVSPGWGKVTPWVLNSGSQFRPDAPPALDSGRYTRDYNETKAFGSLDSSARTTEQTQIALFWNGSPSAIWNSVARVVINSRGLSLSSEARAFALMYIAGADASIACFDAKYTYNFWRPITAIHHAAEDGNERTMPDVNWQPLITTHQHPEYPSGHSTNSSAMATALEMLFGDDPGVLITATSPGNPTFLRFWTKFSQGVDEVLDARVYIGFHFRTSDEVGAKLGRQAARFVVRHALRD